MSTEQDSVRRLARLRAREAWVGEPIAADPYVLVQQFNDTFNEAFNAGWDVRQSAIDSLTAHRDRLQDYVDGYSLDFQHEAERHAHWKARAEAAEADRERLREALELIAGGESLDAAGCARIARAALATPPSEGGANNG